MKRLLFFINLIIGSYANGQSLQSMAPAAVRPDAYNNTPQQALAFVANQAALGRMHHFGAALYGEKRFLLQALSFYHLALAQPTHNGAFGLQVFYSGDADYNTSKTGLAYGQNLGKKLSLGIQFNYWNEHIRGYGNAAQVTVEGGLLLHFSDVLNAGIQVCNPVGVALYKQDKRLLGVYIIGFGYQPSQNILVAAELIKIVHQPLNVQAGIQYRFVPNAWVKGGITSSTASFFIAAGFQLKHFSIEVIGSVHPQLGLSPALLLAYNAMDK